MKIYTFFPGPDTVIVTKNTDGETCVPQAEQIQDLINTLNGDGESVSAVDIVTENADGEVYILQAVSIQDIIDDWDGDCEFVPSNDARVFFAAWNGQPIDPDSYTDFESLIKLLQEKVQ